MFFLQLSMPEVKSQVEAIQAMALEPMAALRALVSSPRKGFEAWLNELLQAEVTVLP